MRQELPTQRLVIVLAALVGLVIASTVASGCSALDDKDASNTTCSEFAEMSPDTGLGKISDQQMDVIKHMMAEQSRTSGQESAAALQVIAYCNIYGGHAGSNPSSPISDIPGLQD